MNTVKCEENDKSFPAEEIRRKIGFMQGRLSPVINDKIQAFPWPYWRDEFEIGGDFRFRLMEWTLDQEDLYRNPLMTVEGRTEIKRLKKKHGINIESLTGDCFMQAPFYKATGKRHEQRLRDLANIIDASVDIGIKRIVIPLVDNGRIENRDQEESLILGLIEISPLLEKAGNMVICFESDFPPTSLGLLINALDARKFGINYDIGNSAALGYNPEDEIAVYARRIVNVHIKDRKLAGGTVPLGSGDADIPGVLHSLSVSGYTGNYILQTARAADGDHAGLLCRYRDMVANWIQQGR